MVGGIPVIYSQPCLDYGAAWAHVLYPNPPSLNGTSARGHPCTSYNTCASIDRFPCIAARTPGPSVVVPGLKAVQAQVR